MRSPLVIAICLALAPAPAAPAQQAAAAAPAQDALDAQAQQYLRLMQPLMWRELEFIRLTCDLTREQRPKVKEAAEKAVLEAARDMARPRRGGVGTVTYAHQTIRKELTGALPQLLTPEQLRRYQKESEQRADTYKQAAINGVVAMIDDVLLLTEEQRDKIAASLLANWQEDWEQWLGYSRYAGRYFPNVPEQFIAAHLTPEQKEVWRGMTKTTISSWGAQVARNGEDDRWWEGK